MVPVSVAVYQVSPIMKIQSNDQHQHNNIVTDGIMLPERYETEEDRDDGVGGLEEISWICVKDRLLSPCAIVFVSTNKI